MKSVGELKPDPSTTAWILRNSGRGILTVTLLSRTGVRMGGRGSLGAGLPAVRRAAGGSDHTPMILHLECLGSAWGACRRAAEDPTSLSVARPTTCAGPRRAAPHPGDRIEHHVPLPPRALGRPAGPLPPPGPDCLRRLGRPQGGDGRG